LFCLDLSFNDLTELDSTLIWCKTLSKLKMLFLEGNPVSLTKNYTLIISERIQGLKMLDGK
jgi:hypothetical protein